MPEHPGDRRFRDTRLWRDRLRPQQLAREPLCRHCAAAGRVELARDVDHIVVPNGDRTLQRAPANFQSLCHSHHSAKTRGGNSTRIKGVGADGYPIDPRHPWRQGTGGTG